MNLFNTDWKNYISKGEKVLKFTGPSWKMSIFGNLLFSLYVFFIMCPFICFVGSFGKCDISKFFSPNGVLTSNIIYTFITWIVFMITYKIAKYVLTDKGIYYTAGWYCRSFIPYNKITKVKIHRNVFDKIFNTGSLKIYTSYKTTVRIIHIKDYKKLNDIINKHIK